VNEEALAHWGGGLLRQKNKNKVIFFVPTTPHIIPARTGIRSGPTVQLHRQST